MTPELSIITVVAGVEPAVNRYNILETALTLHQVIAEIGLSFSFGADN